MKELELWSSCVIIAFSILILGNILLEKKEKINPRTIIITIVLSIIISAVNLISRNTIDNILKLVTIFFSYIGYYKLIFKEELSTTILASFVMYLIIFLSEIIVDITVFIVFYITKIGEFSNIQHTIWSNLIIGIVSIYLALKYREILTKLIKETNFKKWILIVLSILIIIALAIILYNMPLEKLQENINFFITMFLVMVFCIISFIIIKQQRDVNEKEEEYRKLANYSQVTEGVLEEYRLNLHESRNQLIIIRNMIFTTKKKELKEYVNNLIDATEVNKYRWVNELKYIPIPELKGFINFKLMEMSNKKIDIEINVERKLKSSKMKNLKIKDKGDLYNIIGVFLDNAKEASLESKEKRVAIEMYEIDSDLHIVIANTYKGKIDIEKINEYGYSSKGKNRGTGLHLVNKIIERNSMFERITSKIDEYFVQELTVHLENVQ